MSIYILIYIAGFIISYYGWKLLGVTHGWESVGLRLFISIFSWVGIAVLISFLIQDFFLNNKIFKKDPPKWL
jgi:hypothetical protein